MRLQHYLSILACLATLSLAYEEETEDAIEEGKRRWEEMKNPQGDTTVNCDLSSWENVLYNSDGPDDLVRQSIELGGLELGSSNWYPVANLLPQGSNIDSATTKFYCAYNPSAIVYFDIVANGAPLSSADVSWTSYKAVVDKDKNPDGSNAGQNGEDYKKLQYLFHTDVTSDNADEVFGDFAESGEVATFEPDTDGFFALLGLDNGATVSGIVRFHNEELGGKNLVSVSAVYIEETGQACLWYTLG